MMSFEEMKITASVMSIVAVIIFGPIQLLLLRFFDLLPPGRKYGKSKKKGTASSAMFEWLISQKITFGSPKITSYWVIAVSSVMVTIGHLILVYTQGKPYAALGLILVFIAAAIPITSAGFTAISITVKGGWGLAQLSEHSGTTKSP